MRKIDENNCREWKERRKQNRWFSFVLCAIVHSFFLYIYSVASHRYRWAFYVFQFAVNIPVRNVFYLLSAIAFLVCSFEIVAVNVTSPLCNRINKKQVRIILHQISGTERVCVRRIVSEAGVDVRMTEAYKFSFFYPFISIGILVKFTRCVHVIAIISSSELWISVRRWNFGIRWYRFIFISWYLIHSCRALRVCVSECACGVCLCVCASDGVNA